MVSWYSEGAMPTADLRPPGRAEGGGAPAVALTPWGPAALGSTQGPVYSKMYSPKSRSEAATYSLPK